MPKHPTCFMSGARIRAARGDVAVDTISAGEDVVVVRDNQETLERVTWVGHSHIDVARHARPEEAAPVRFRKGAVSVNRPSRDLLVSPEHCLILDGLCVPAKLLVNGGSIVSEREHAPFTYYHLELERHGTLLAENTPAESYLDTGNRASFDNGDQPWRLHPGFVVNEGSARWATDACAPLAKVPEQVEPIWCRLAERSAAIGFPVPAVETVDDAKLRLVADGREIEALSDRNARHVFLVPAGATSVSLRSRFCIPADRMVPGHRDTRRLGVRVNWIAIRPGDGGETIVSADHPGLVDGWNEIERDGAAMWRWTDGAAAIPWQAAAATAIVTVCCSQVDRYPVRGDAARLIA